MRRKRKKIIIPDREIDLMNLDLLKKYLVGGEGGKRSRILPRSVNNLSRKSHSRIVESIKRARQLNLL